MDSVKMTLRDFHHELYNRYPKLSKHFFGDIMDSAKWGSSDFLYDEYRVYEVFLKSINLNRHYRDYSFGEVLRHVNQNEKHHAWWLL